MLLIADLHLGKVTHFRKAGLGLPAAVEQENLDRLNKLIIDHDPSEILILGDLFHSQLNEMWAEFLRFMGEFKTVKFTLIMGNHDILEDHLYKHPQLRCLMDLTIGPFLFTHHPTFKEDLYNICGHIHPGIRLVGQGLQSLRLPCYIFREKGAILPAFGAFTGLKVISPLKSDNIYAIADDTVTAVN